MPRKRKKTYQTYFSTKYFVISLIAVLALTLSFGKGLFLPWSKNSKLSSASSNSSQITNSGTTLQADELTTASEASATTKTINNGDFIWEGGRYIDEDIKISLEVPAGWSITRSESNDVPFLEIYSNDKPLSNGQWMQPQLVEKVTVYPMELLLNTAEVVAQEDTVTILKSENLTVNKKYAARRTDTFGAENGLKLYNTFIGVGYKDQLVGFDFQDIGFFELPKTQQMLHSLEFIQ